ncbi:hypothetical protein INR49_009395 [Caranx melampygus]|nr:hypothetical protein INR49_009395 [Caranx melampygus]
MVPLAQWYSPENIFTCSVSFFNGSDTVYRSAWVTGTRAPRGGRFVRVSNSVKMSYLVLMGKSCIFGVFVALLVWKLQGLCGKQKDQADSPAACDST